MKSAEITGLLRPRGHCLFTWRASAADPQRKLVYVTSAHCADCVAALRSSVEPGTTIVLSDSPRDD